MTNAGLTAALAPLREELDKIEAEAPPGPVWATWPILRTQARAQVAREIRSALDHIHPEPDTLAALGMVALGMLREFRDTSVVVTRESVDDWNKRADELLAAADAHRA